MADFFAGGAGAIANVGAGIVSNLFGIYREKQAREENYKYNELAAQNADVRTRALYNDLYSPKAQLEQLKSAGLSPSLFYGDGGGISGQTGAMGAGASGVSPTTFGIDPLQGMQLQLMQAQARNLNAEADLKEGKNQMGAAQIKEYLASAGLKEAEMHYSESLKAGADLKNYITEHTKDFQISTAYAISEKASHEIKTALFTSLKTEQEAKLFADTYEEQIRSIKITNDLKLSEKMLNKAMKAYNEAEVQKIGTLIQKWENEVNQGWADVYISAFRAKTEKERNEIINDYFDGQIKNLEERLEFDKNKFSREMRYAWITYGLTFLNDNNHYFGDKLMEFVPNFNTKKPNPIGFR